MNFTRRSFLAATAAFPLVTWAQQAKAKHILLRSSWQTVNIGDIAHTPGILKILETHLPDVLITLWPSSIDRGVEEMLLKNFPKLKVIKGKVDAEGKPDAALAKVFGEADFMLHGSGPSVVAASHLEAWHKNTRKPFGIYGVTLENFAPKTRDILSAAAFVFCRDTASLKYLRDESGVKGPVMDFTPDATFALHIRDDERAAAYMKEAGLEEGKFICMIPRLRYTPYKNRPIEDQKRRAEVSDQFKEQDHRKMREAVTAFVRKTGMKVLACPEMTYQLEIIAPLLIDPLPDDVKKNVVERKTYWVTDEAASVYAKAHSIVSFEMHSPIIAVANGTPAIHLRQPTDTRKGQMWRDVGLADWLFEIDDSTGEQIAAAMLSIHADYGGAKAKVKQANELVKQSHAKTIGMLKDSLK